jgi:hypothetical protein
LGLTTTPIVSSSAVPSAQPFKPSSETQPAGVSAPVVVLRFSVAIWPPSEAT